jgi:hypothetical protein
VEVATCGKGLAANSRMPRAAGELMRTMAGVLDAHQRALDLADSAAGPEHHVYVTLVLELRGVAAGLEAIAARMANARDLPMGRHDEKTMVDAVSMDAFGAFLRAEAALHEVLTANIAAHQAMLEDMRGSDLA